MKIKISINIIIFSTLVSYGLSAQKVYGGGCLGKQTEEGEKERLNTSKTYKYNQTSVTSCEQSTAAPTYTEVLTPDTLNRETVSRSLNGPPLDSKQRQEIGKEYFETSSSYNCNPTPVTFSKQEIATSSQKEVFSANGMSYEIVALGDLRLPKINNVEFTKYKNGVCFLTYPKKWALYYYPAHSEYDIKNHRIIKLKNMENAQPRTIEKAQEEFNKVCERMQNSNVEAELIIRLIREYFNPLLSMRNESIILPNMRADTVDLENLQLLIFSVKEKDDAFHIRVSKTIKSYKANTAKKSLPQSSSHAPH